MKFFRLGNIILIGCAFFFTGNIRSQTTILSENFEGAWTVIGGSSTTCGNTTIPGVTPASQTWCGGTICGSNSEVCHRSDYCTGWATCNNICTGTYKPPTCGANGTNYAAIWDGYDVSNGCGGFINSPSLNLSGYCSASLSFYYLNYDETDIYVSFWNGSSWVNAATLPRNSSYAWTYYTVSVPTSCLINGTILQFEAVSRFQYYPIGIDEILLTAISGGPANDNFASATALTVNAAAISGTTQCGTTESNESFACNNSSDVPGYTVVNTVWYKFTASASGHNYVQINQTAGCYANFGATVWDPSIAAQQPGTTYQQTGAYAYCGMISCQQMYGNNAASNPFLFDLCNLTAGNTYYVQVVTGNESAGTCGMAGATFNISVTSSNPGGTVTNPCQQAGISQNYIASNLSTAGAGPIAECYINACNTAPGCPSCTTYSLNGATGVNQNNIVWNDYYSFTTANGCSNDLEFQQCVVAQASSPCNHGNVAWLSFQLYTPSGQCITSGDLGTPADIDVYGYLGIPGVGCQESYVLQYTSEQLNCTYWAYTPFTDNYGSSTCVLPIVLTRFTANEGDDGNIDLNWSTATETNNDYFTIARSIDGKSFIDIGKVKGSGNANYLTNYQFTDTTAKELGKNIFYYRLSQTDFNGNSNDFNVVEVNLSKNFSVSVYPNPSTGDFNLDFSSNQGQFVRVDLVDISGVNLSSKLYMGSGGLQHQKLQVPQDGMYILNITINGQVIHKKIVKQ